jgi:choline monooxygenase
LQLVGRENEIDGLHPVTLLPVYIDEPLLLSRVGDGTICMSNVCTHRGKILVEEPCKPDLIRCCYHGRRFALDGKFLSMPEFDGVESFPSDSDNLPRVPLAERGGFLFASVNPIDSFENFIADVADRFGGIDPHQLKLTGTRDYEIDAHWALYCENYLEGFHIPFVHKSLNTILDYGTYSTETFRYTSLQTGYGEDGEIAGRYLFIFPNTMFNFYPWGVSVNIVKPVSPTKTIVSYLTYVSDVSKTGTGAGGDLDRVEMEDQAVVASVQKGIRSRFYSQGRYSPTREQGTHHFHRLIAEFMN